MKNNQKKSPKSCDGITLIALVITIIVLLILAGISISMLSGDNSILQKTTDAETNTGRTAVIEQAKIDILGQIADNKGEKLTKTQLKTILKKYFKDVDSLVLPDNLSNSDITLNVNSEYGGYQNIALSEIYSGLLSSQISFYYKNYVTGDIIGPFNVIEGLTFREWIETYHSFGFTIDEYGNLFNTDGMSLVEGEGESMVLVEPDTLIKGDFTYNTWDF